MKFLNLWTSGTDFGGAEGDFYWAGTGDPLTFTDWLPNEPNNWFKEKGGEHCIEYVVPPDDSNAFGWFDALCMDKYHFVCEI